MSCEVRLRKSSTSKIKYLEPLLELSHARQRRLLQSSRRQSCKQKEISQRQNYVKQTNKQNLRISNHLHCFMTEWPVSPESEEGGWTARKDAGGTAQERRWRWDILETSNTGYLLWSHRARERRMLRRLGKRENESRSGQFRKRTKALLLHAHWAKKRFCRENQFSIYY